MDDGEGAERAGGQAGGRGFHDDGADEGAGDGLGGDAAGGGGGAGAGDGAGAGLLAEGDDGGVVGGDGVAGGVLDRRGQDPRGAGGQVRRRAGERDLRGRAVDDGERAERAGGETQGRGLHDDGPDEGTGDRLGGDAARRRRGAGPGDGAGAGLLAEGDDGGVVGGDGVAGGVPQRRGEDAGRARGQVRGRARQRDVCGGAVDDGEGAERAGGEAGGGRLHDDRTDERTRDRLRRRRRPRRSRCRCR